MAHRCADTTQGRRKFIKRLDLRALSEEAENCGVPVSSVELDARLSHIRRGWYWGSQQFAEEGEHQATRWLNEAIAASGVSRRDFIAMKNSDPIKLSVAQLLWQRTTVSQRWLAEQLQMRTAANVSQLLKRFSASSLTPAQQKPLPPPFRHWMQSVN